MKRWLVGFILGVGCCLSFMASASSGHSHSEDGHGDSIKEPSKHSEHKHGHDRESVHKGDHKNDHGHGHEGDSGAQKGGAILGVKAKGKKFRLGSAALATLELNQLKLKSMGRGIFLLPVTSVVEYQDKIGVYRRSEDWFELIPIRIVFRDRTSVKLVSKVLAFGDKIVTDGVPLLRIAHLQASGHGGHGHSH